MLATEIGCDVCGFGSVENVSEWSPTKPCPECGTVAREASIEEERSESPSAIRVWDLFGGHLRFFESGDVRYWDGHERRWCQGWGRFLDEKVVGEDERRLDEWRAAADAYQTRPPAAVVR